MLINIAALALAIYIGLAILLYFLQARLLFFPSADLYRAPDSAGWQYEDVTLNVSDETTHAWWIPHPTATANTVLFSHGNAGNIADRLESCAQFRSLGLNILIYDYGGYGKSTGSPGEQRCYSDARAAWKWLTQEKQIAPEHIILFGRSLGAGPASQLATEVKPAGIILESAFASVPDMAQQLYPVFPARLLVRHRFDNAAKAPRFTAPLLIIHSPDDSVIPYAQGRKLFEAAREPKQFLEIQGDHNEGFIITGAPYTDAVKAFITPLLSH
jgi:fermentation-respiration switch protein FrsA (DUF1100 family)